jgi:hypothetical protein
VLDLLRENWVIGWLGLLVSAITAITVLWRAKLEKEKLALEVKLLRNSPEVVADRRKIYERLRDVLQEITQDASVSKEQIEDLHSISHDSALRFPVEITEGVKVLIKQVVELYGYQKAMDAMRGRVPDTEWHDIVEKEHRAIMAVALYKQQMLETFKPHLSL